MAARRVLRRAAPAFAKLNPKALAMTGAIIGLICAIIGVIWHVGMGQPSIMQILYPAMAITSPLLWVGCFILFIVVGYILGYVLAALYNWSLNRRY